jgi:hypothetical protein
MRIKGHIILFITTKLKVVINCHIPGANGGMVARLLAIVVDIFMEIDLQDKLFALYNEKYT